MKRALLFALMLLSILITVKTPVRAAEITLNSGDYGYGSTSEYSASSAKLTSTDTPLTVTPPAAMAGKKTTLASTGDPAVAIKIMAVSLVGIGILGSGILIYKKRFTNR